VPWLLVALLIAAAALAGWWAYNQIQDQLEETAPVGVPFVEGLREEQAVEQIEAAGLEAEIEEQPSTDVEPGIVMEQSPKEGTQVSKGSTVTLTVSSGPREVEVPRLVGLTYEDAVDALNEVNLEPRRVNVFSQKPVGQVTAQTPKAGETAIEGSEVEVRVSKGVQEVAVPSVLGLSESNARTTLEAAGFEVTSTEAPDDDTAAGLVAAQSPEGGAKAAKGSTVAITISTGPELTTVPDVVGQLVADARSMLQDAGFRPRTINQDVDDPSQDGVVLSQNPTGNAQARPGSTVTIVVGRFNP